ncbi:MAG: M24 family metallopeptidase [Alphaproteobacteria bacterium]|nr:M24 family metallopeptidase [Alphaproteobacteria bacterium]
MTASVTDPIGQGQLYPQFSLAERDRRWKLVRSLMAKEDLPVIVVPNNTGHSTDFQASARWLSHVGGGGDTEVAVTFPLEGEPSACANRANTDWSAPVQHWTTKLYNTRRNTVSGVIEHLRELKTDRGKVGVVGLGAGTRTPMGTILQGFYTQMRDAFPNAQFVDATHILEEARYQKSEEEVAALQKSIDIIEKGIEAKVAAARPGVVDWHIWAAVQSALLMNGSEIPVHCNWVCGPNAKHTRTRATFRKIEKGDLIINEIEASWIGYRAQQVQPVFVQEVDPVHAELIKVQGEVYARLLEILRPGVTVGEMAEKTKEITARALPAKGPAAGARGRLNMHGRGQGDDGPLITPGQVRPEQLARPLRENMAFIFKPAVITADEKYESVWGDTIIITPKGGRRLGSRPHGHLVSGL